MKTRNNVANRAEDSLDLTSRILSSQNETCLLVRRGNIGLSRRWRKFRSAMIVISDGRSLSRHAGRASHGRTIGWKQD
jgi:hypothetical protein